MTQLFKLKNGTVLLSTEAPGGVYNSAQLRKIADLCSKELAVVKATEDQRLALFVKESEVDRVVQQLRAIGLGFRHYQDGLHQPVSCLGELCEEHAQPALHSAMELTKDIADLALESQLKIGINGCARCCTPCHTLDIAIVGEPSGYRISLGGRNSQLPQLSSFFAEAVPAKELAHLIRKVVQAFQAQATPGESLHDLIERVGVESFVKALAPYSQDAAHRQDPFAAGQIPAAPVKPLSEVSKSLGGARDQAPDQTAQLGSPSAPDLAEGDESTSPDLSLGELDEIPIDSDLATSLDDDLSLADIPQGGSLDSDDDISTAHSLDGELSLGSADLPLDPATADMDHELLHGDNDLAAEASEDPSETVQEDSLLVEDTDLPGESSGSRSTGTDPEEELEMDLLDQTSDFELAELSSDVDVDAHAFEGSHSSPQEGSLSRSPAIAHQVPNGPSHQELGEDILLVESEELTTLGTMSSELDEDESLIDTQMDELDAFEEPDGQPSFGEGLETELDLIRQEKSRTLQDEKTHQMAVAPRDTDSNLTDDDFTDLPELDAPDDELELSRDPFALTLPEEHDIPQLDDSLLAEAVGRQQGQGVKSPQSSTSVADFDDDELAGNVPELSDEEENSFEQKLQASIEEESRLLATAEPDLLETERLEALNLLSDTEVEGESTAAADTLQTAWEPSAGQEAPAPRTLPLRQDRAPSLPRLGQGFRLASLSFEHEHFRVGFDSGAYLDFDLSSLQEGEEKAFSLGDQQISVTITPEGYILTIDGVRMFCPKNSVPAA